MNETSSKLTKQLTKKLIGVVSLGCDKNRVDTETMLTYLNQAGFRFTSDPKEANVIIINTCAFIAKARKEAVDTIDEMLEYKKKGKCEKIIVTGCMPQKYLPELKKEFKTVDCFLGFDDYPNIAQIVSDLYDKGGQIVRCGNASTIACVENRMITTPNHYAYLKIADGCENYCTFCTIPFIRGRFRSKPIDEVAREAKSLVNGGATELILVAQDVTKYGTDLFGKPALVDLIKKLSKIKDLRWIRLLYCYPELVTDELLNEVVTNDKVCKYLDIPFQHVSDNVLKMMNRHINHEKTIALVEKIRALPVHIAIRTTFMVGFPGETDKDFAELVDFVKRYKLDQVGFFAYSKEEGTVAAKMPNQVDEKTKNKRLLAIMKEAEKVQKANLRAMVGKTVDVVYEDIDYDRELFVGRSQYQAPEIDNLIYFKSKDFVDVGGMYPVKITRVMGCDLKGEKL